MNPALLTAEDITKKYNRQVILNSICLSVGKGEGIALVGENGCGKSTLLRILCKMTNPTSGSIICTSGLRLAFIPDRFEKINMTARRFMWHMSRLEGFQYSAAEQYCNEYGLNNMLDTPMKYLSKGTLQKIAVIQALQGERDILIMDEPFSGQDTGSKAGFAAELRRRKENGMAIIMACHEFYLIEQFGDNIIEIKNGALVNGAEYILRQRRPVCSFLIDYAGSDISKILANEEICKSITVSRVGPMLKLKADRIYARDLFRIFIEKNMHIVKYEESEDKC